MNQLEQQTEDWLNEILGNVEGQYSSHDGKIREIVKDIFQAGQETARESIKNTKLFKLFERHTQTGETITLTTQDYFDFINLINSKE